MKNTTYSAIYLNTDCNTWQADSYDDAENAQRIVNHLKGCTRYTRVFFYEGDEYAKLDELNAPLEKEKLAAEFNIQDLKETILDEFNGEYKLVGSDIGNLADIGVVALTGFAQQICETVSKFRRVSEKQAYCIARGIVEQFDSLEAFSEAFKEKAPIR